MLLLVAYSGNEAYGQIITDSDKKLKTQKKDRKDKLFGIFNKKKGQSSSGPFNQKRSNTAPRTTGGSPFTAFNKRKQQTPRSISSQRRDLFKNQRYTSPRYSSSGLAGVMSGKKKPAPRYSSGQPFSSKDKITSPRYSSGKPFQKSFFAQLLERKSNPRYSSGQPFSNKEKLASPRYSGGMPFTRRDKSVTPRYSSGSPYEQTFLERLFSTQPTIRYSVGPTYTKKDRAVSPRYSVGDPFKKSWLARIFTSDPYPRYSVGSPFDSKQYLITPKYSTNKNRFEVDERLKKQSRIYDFASSKYRGTYRKSTRLKWNVDNLWLSSKTKRYEGNKVPRYGPQQNTSLANYSGSFKQKSINQKKMHPSAKHLSANQDSEAVRGGIRKWNIFWTRLNRNKVQPDAVTDKISKPKFDRKEAKIWND